MMQLENFFSLEMYLSEYNHKSWKNILLHLPNKWARINSTEENAFFIYEAFQTNPNFITFPHNSYSRTQVSDFYATE